MTSRPPRAVTAPTAAAALSAATTAYAAQDAEQRLPRIVTD
ncbi:hypothetical protein J2Z21_009162 [Streptomyces griseochromogenes]|uniref:Uncharacterized protein n=1 Tax=Streptomyces griseochromogenes TaxID=68214 RepID=A0ABS4M8Y2_9ACTN|nr:hypothetical protein [Streptomyces griseochromogenes]MBP2056145.1 hypothetical protein [Streptomyces griseochromogenes]